MTYSTAQELHQNNFIQLQLIKPTIIYTYFENSKKPQVINGENNETTLIFNYDGKQYRFSNEKGHQVIQDTGRQKRPMTRKEFNQICALMIQRTSTFYKSADDVIEEVSKLDYAKGHANTTFEVTASPLSSSSIDVLTINLGNARFIYNQSANTVLHIDHSKLINGRMLQGEEKEKIIQKIKTSKTMTKKINEVMQQTK